MREHTAAAAPCSRYEVILVSSSGRCSPRGRHRES
jgi:hypothetical protein